MAEYDLTPRFLRFLDPHLALPLTRFLAEKKLYDAGELLKGRFDLLCKTKLVDLALDVLKQIATLEPKILSEDEIHSLTEELGKKRDDVVRELEQTYAAMDKVKTLLANPRLAETLAAGKQPTAAELERDFGLGPAQLDTVHRYARAQFDTGCYQPATEYAALYCSLGGDPGKIASALWGKLAGEILMRQWDAALADVHKLREAIDAGAQARGAQQTLQQRTWLLHWAMFAFFHSSPDGRNACAELMFNDRYMNAVQTSAPHLLRYLAVAVVVNRRRRASLADLAKVLRQERNQYTDPVTDFVESLVLSADIDAAREKLPLCRQVLANDFFLCGLADEFAESGRMLVFESLCRVHQRIDIAALAEKLGMERDVAERWVVDLIRNSRFDAKIDSAAGRVLVTSPFSSVHQQVIEKTKQLSLRSVVLGNFISQLEQTGAVAPQQRQQQQQQQQQRRSQQQHQQQQAI